MIVYQLACPRDHFFEGWFASAEACDRQAGAGQLECPTCASADIRKLPAAPHVHTSGSGGASSTPVDPALREKVVQALRQFLLTHTEDVGGKFAEVARRIHYKEEEARNIRGRATVEEAIELQEEGVEAFAIAADVLPPAEGIH